VADVPAAPSPVGPDRFRTDVAIVGAGVAGLYAAVRLPGELDAVIVDKGSVGRSGSSPWAQGGMAVALGPDDSPELHARDTERAGDGLCDPVAVRTLTHQAPDVVAHLIELGAVFDTDPGTGPGTDPETRTGAATSAPLHLAREGGQSVARSVHRADATGAELVQVLRSAAGGRVSRLGGNVVALAAAAGGSVAGVWVWHQDRLVLLEARAVLLATGGCGGLFAATTNQDRATGDGVALAYASGAAVRDLEFVQFHPTGLAVSGAWRFLLTEALRGAGGTLHDRDGRRFMPDLHPDAELAPRHVVAKAILDQPGGAWLDVTHLPPEQLEHEFPTVLHGAREHGFDLATERVPVTPAAHYMVGGVRTDLDGRTSRPGLYAAGEVASTGVHGANRMAGNSLTEALVFGARSAAAIAGDLPAAHAPVGAPPPVADHARAPDDLAALRQRLRDAMWVGAGPVRDDQRLATCLGTLDRLAEELGPAGPSPDQQELVAAVGTARLIASSARLRPESRGGHHRLDHPAPSAAWADVHLERARPA
jgi:L-aspartate oxidase